MIMVIVGHVQSVENHLSKIVNFHHSLYEYKNASRNCVSLSVRMFDKIDCNRLH